MLNKFSNKFSIAVLFLLYFLSINQVYANYGENVRLIHPEEIKVLRSEGIDYIFIDSSTFGNAHICGAIYISYTWVYPKDKGMIKKILIPNDFYIFCY